MSAKRDPLVYLEDIHESLRVIQDYVKGMTEDEFEASLKTQDAVIRRLLIMGEAAARLPEAFKLKHPEVPWHKIVGMRNRLVHDYDEVKLSVLWDTIREDFPMLTAQLKEVLGKED